MDGSCWCAGPKINALLHGAPKPEAARIAEADFEITAAAATGGEFRDGATGMKFVHIDGDKTPFLVRANATNTTYFIGRRRIHDGRSVKPSPYPDEKYNAEWWAETHATEKDALAALRGKDEVKEYIRQVKEGATMLQAHIRACAMKFG